MSPTGITLGRLAWRTLTLGVRAAATLVFLVFLIVASVFVNIGTPVVRRVVIQSVNTFVFDRLFQGTFSIVSLDHVDPFGVSGARVRIDDPTGQPVLIADGVRSRFATLTLLRTLLTSRRDLVIDLGNVSIQNVDIRLDMDDRGLALANVFLPRVSTSEAPSSPPDGHGVRVFAPHIHIEHVWAHGTMTSLPYLDGDGTDLDAAFSFGPSLLTVDARKGSIVARGIALGADAAGRFHGHFELVPETGAMSGRGGWVGKAGAIEETLEGALGKGRFDLTLDVAETSPEAIRSLWPSSPIGANAQAHVEAHGPLESIELAAHGSLGAATVDVKGTLEWGPEKGADVHIGVAAADLREFAPAAPASLLGLAADVGVRLAPDGRLSGHADVDVLPGRIGTYPVPHATLKATGSRVATGAFGGDATLDIDEPGAPTTIVVRAVPRGPSATVDFTVTSRALRLGAIREVSTHATGNARVAATGSVDLETGAIELRVDAHGSAVHRGELSVASVDVTGRARGHLLDPEVSLTVHTLDAAWNRTTLAKVDVSFSGTALSPHVTVHEESPHLPDVDGVLDADFRDGVVLRRVDLHLTHRRENVRVRVNEVRIAPADVAVNDVTVEGIGAPASATFELVGDRLRLQASAPDLELARLARLLDLDEVIRRGTLSFDADASLGLRRASGRVTASLAHVAIGTVEEISAHLDGELHDRRLAGTLKAQVNAIGTLEVAAKELVFGGTAPLTRSSWQEASGDVALVGHVDLARLLQSMPAGMRMASAMSGALDVKARVERDDANDFTPLVNMDIATAGLEISGPMVAARAGDAAQKTSAPAWIVRGVDTNTSIRVNGTTGAVEVAAHFTDREGELALVEASSASLPYKAFYTAPATALALMPTVPFQARLTLPRRPLSRWPAFLGRLPVDGDMQAQLQLTGPLLTPRAALSAKMTPAGQALARLTSPLDFDLKATYDGARADVDLHATQETRPVLTAEAHALVAARDLFAHMTELPWTASAKVHVDAFPLVTIGPLDDRQVRGRVTGDVELDDLHADAKARASLSIASLKIGDAAYSHATASLTANGKTVDAEVRLEEDDGFGAAKATMAATWGAALLPVPDPKQALKLTLQAKRLRAAFILPFLRGGVDELDGLIDADAHASVDPASRAVHVEGTADITDGLFELAAFGGELHAISGKLRVTNDGVVTLDDVTAQGVSGEITASARARLDGVRLVGANAVILVPKSRALPLSVNGAQLGTVDGRFNVTESLSADHRTVDVKLDVPTLHFVAPEAGSQDVQTLGPIAGMTIGRHEGSAGTFVPEVSEDDDDASSAKRAADALALRIETHLGGDVSVRRGTDVRVELTGGPTITVADTTRVTGQVQLRRGVLNLYGKVFAIERGTVSFVGEDPSNPQVNVTAGWTAPDGTQVKADFVGPLKSGKVTLHSEPPLSRNDIVQLLLFGTTEGQAAVTPGASSAEGLAGNVATQPLNRALSQFGLSAVSAKVDSSNASNAKPEVEVQIAKDISLQVAEVLYIGPPPPGSAPDRTLFTIDWRFLRKWSLEATVGDAGSTIVDLIWQYRY